MRNYFLIKYHRARMNWHRMSCCSMVAGGGLNHQARMAMDANYFNAYTAYEESRNALKALGAL